MVSDDKTTAATTAATNDATAAATTAATTDKGTAANATTAAAASTTAATTAAPAAATTLTADPDAAKTKSEWPDDWQSRMAGADDKELKQISRYASPADVWKKARELEKRMSSGEVRTALPKDAKPEEVAAWRKDNGIPEAPDKYDLTGIAITESDKPIISDFLKRAHDSNMTPAQARTAIEAYGAQRVSEQQQRAAKDVEQQQQALDELNKEWGGNYRRNINILTGTVLSKFPESVRSLVQEARLPDGTFLLNSVDAVRGLVALGMELNPAGIVVPAVGGDLGKSAMDEYKGIQKTMRENRTAYNKDAGMQARFIELADYLSKNELIDGQGNEIVRKRKAA